MRQLTLHLLGLSLLSLTGCGGLNMSAANAAAPAGTGFSVREVVIDGEPHKYGLFIPHAYSAGKPTPAIVFLHGLLEGGSDGVTAMKKGLSSAIAKRANTFPAIAIFPQSGGDWTGAAR